MKIEPEAKSLIGPSVYPTLLKLGTIQSFFFSFSEKKVLLFHFLPILLIISIVLVPSTLLPYAPLS